MSTTFGRRIVGFKPVEARGLQFVSEPRDEVYGRVAVFLDIAGNKWDLLGPSLAERSEVYMSHGHGNVLKGFLVGHSCVYSDDLILRLFLPSAIELTSAISLVSEYNVYLLPADI